MTTSVLLARFFGLYLLIVGATLLIRREQLPRIIRDFFDNSALMLFSGILTLVFGLLIILFHNIWTWNWNLPITIIGYLALLQGIVRLWFPDHMKRMLAKHMNTRFVINAGIILMLLGVYFAHHGFLAHH